MHAFMTAVLLRMAGLDAFDANAEPKPPDRQLRYGRRLLSLSP
jgi:hypothetical protein